MIPSAANSDYPKFVANQVLTSENLNDLFGYLDEQGRLTRTNLTGIGIVCGLQVHTAADGTSVTIRKGVGITSSGYLVSVPEITYNRRSVAAYDSLKCACYDKFVNLDNKTKRFDLWELKQNAETEGTTALNSSFLNEKIVLLFVELLETNNKNCDPNSCDSKGTQVTVNIRPLLAAKSSVDTFLSNSSNNPATGKAILLPELKMPRFNVPASVQANSNDLFKAYLDILNKTFVVDTVQNKLTNAYSKLAGLLVPEFPANPFLAIDSKFSFLFDGTITQNQSINLQYYYDLFSDLIQAYNELRCLTSEFTCECLTEEHLFPRHLLLGEALGFNEMNSLYRTRFVPSPASCCCSGTRNELKLLFRRLVYLVQNFFLTDPDSVLSKSKTIQQKITPSLLGSDPLSKKAIPFYYEVDKQNAELYRSWNYKRTRKGTAHQILSYHAFDYNKTDDFVINPLKYELEPANFFRIEGHIGKDYYEALSEILKIKNENRLPFEVILLKTGMLETDNETIPENICQGDLEINYDIVRREWEAIVGQTIEYLDDNKSAANALIGASVLSAYVKLLHHSKTFMVDDLPQFITSYQSFMPVYEAIEREGKSIRTELMQQIISNQIKNRELAEDLIDHFDELIVSCKKGAFRALMQAYSTAKKYALSKLYFGNYIKDHPGIQHKAGVTPGGTFILVYHENAKTQPEKKSVKTTDKTFFVAEAKAVEEKAVKTSADEDQKIRALIEKIKKTRSSDNDETELKNKLFELAMGVSDKQTGTAEAQLSIKDGTVIADFYLPYLCCTDCTPIQFTVPEPAPNKAPVARPGDNITITLPVNELILDGSLSSDPDGTIQTYEWKQVSGSVNASIQNPSAAITKVSNLEKGLYVLSLTVTDDDGASDTKQISIQVNEKPNIPPIAVAQADKPQIVLPENTITLNGLNSSDPDGTIVAFNWSLSSGPANGFVIDTPDKVTSKVTFTQAGNYMFKLTVTDNKGVTASATTTVTVLQEVENKPPVAVASANPSNVLFIPGQPAVTQLNGSASTDSDGTIVAFNWSLSSGPPTGFAIDTPDKEKSKVSFTQTGNYEFKLSVTDNRGATASTTVAVKVARDFVTQKTCATLGNIIDDFAKLPEADTAENFKTFTARYKELREISQFFNLMQSSNLTSQSVDAQIKFFTDQKIETRLVTWIDKLEMFFIEFKDLRLLALLMLQILSRLAYYISCIQGMDVNSADVKMATALESLITQIKVILEIIDVFEPKHINILINLGTVSDTERNRLKNNNEETLKPIYANMLDEILSLLKTL